jgi:hypothetical protein
MEQVDKLSDAITDPVTLELMTDPYLTPCQHTFEKSTLMNLLRQATPANCPTCRNSFTEADIKANFAMRDVIASTTPILESLRSQAQLKQIADAKAAPAPATAAAEPENKEAKQEVGLRVVQDSELKTTMVEILTPSAMERVGTDLCLCIDNSGSMSTNVTRKDEMAKKSMMDSLSWIFVNMLHEPLQLPLVPMIV